MTDLERAAQKLIDAVTFDMHGIDGRGGNGGLISNETLRAADELRLALYRAQQTAEPESTPGL
jgi:hypothetical protein